MEPYVATPQSRPQRNKITDRLKGIWMVYTILALIGGVMVLAIWRREGELSQAVPVALGLLFGLSMPWTLRAHRYVAIQWLNVRATVLVNQVHWPPQGAH